VTFLGADFIDGVQLKRRIQKSDESEILVDLETLNFIENPDIATIPQTLADYIHKSELITPLQLEHIMHPKALSPSQEEMMSHLTQSTSLAISEAYCYGRGRGDSTSSCMVKRTLSYCVACLFGTAHKRPWQSKSKESHPIRKKSDNYPSAQASLDHLVSAQPGLIPHFSGKLTGLRVNGATIFVDHHSDHVYVFLMRDLTLDETILAKHAYERFLSSIGVTSKAYHTDNGQFADKGFCDDCITCNQVITFCSIRSHHQNGIAERKIKELTLGGRTLLLHAKRMLPEYVSTILWPFALKCCKDRLNNLVHRADDQTPYEMLAGLESFKMVMSNFHTFGCPCYVLDHQLQSGNMEWYQNGSLVLACAYMLVVHPHTLLTLLLSLIQGLATSHLNFTLSLMMISPWCPISLHWHGPTALGGPCTVLCHDSDVY